MKGGNPQITEGITSYDKIYKYLLELLNRPDFKQIYEKNIKFIKSININNDNFSDAFNFSTNELFRNFINDLLQWLLFDYNPYIFDTLLTVIYSCFNDPESPKSPEFLKNNVDSLDDNVDSLDDNDGSLQILFKKLDDMIIGKAADVEKLKKMIKTMVAKDNVDSLDDNDGSLQILFKKLQDMILYKIGQAGNDVEKRNEINLLTLILYVLTIPSVTTAVSDFINKNKAVFRDNLKDIKCVLVEITYDKIKNNQVVRNAMTNYFYSFDPKIRYTKIPGLVGNIAKCLPNLLNTFVANFFIAKVNAVSQSFDKHIVSPAQSLYSQANALGETISENVLAPVRAKAQSIYSQARDNIPTVFGRLPVP